MDKQQMLQLMALSGVPEDMACCSRIIDYIERNPGKKIHYYSDFLNAVTVLQLCDPIQNVQRCINLLASKKIDLLRQEYRYLDDDGVIYSVDVKDIQEAYEFGALNLEALNYPDPDFASKIYVVFPVNVGAL